MPQVKIINLTKKFKSAEGKEITALKKINLKIKNKKYNTLLGPSGCGKTTLLRIIAGLARPTCGKILFNNKEVTELPTQDRNVGFVFQNFAIFPHLDVWGNVSYGPVVRGWPGDEIKLVTKKNLKLVGLLKRSGALPSELSGGMQQRLGLARALATNSELLLLDEPLSALDVKIGAYLRYELRKIVKNSGVTAIHVTHNQEEAMTISDNIILMKKGRIIQSGSPEELYEKPQSIFAANFIGKCNFFKVKKISSHQVNLCGKPLKLNHEIKNDNLVLGIRPEKLYLEPRAGKGFAEGRIDLINFLGHLYEYRINVDGVIIKAYKRIKKKSIKKDFKVGDKISFWFHPEDAFIFKAPKDLKKELSLE